MAQAIRAREWEKERRSAMRDRRNGVEKFRNYICEAIESNEFDLQEFSIAEAFKGLVEDGRDVFEAMDPAYEWTSEAAVNTSLFSYITKAVIGQKVMNQFNLEDFVLSRLIPTETSRIQSEVIPGMTWIGDRGEIVAEAELYPTVTFGEDWVRMPIAFKHGMIIPITREAVFFDRTNLILKMAGMIGEWLGVQKEKEIADTIIDNPRGSATSGQGNRYEWRGTQYATYDTGTNWTNSAANQLADYTDIENAEALFDNMTDPQTGEPILLGGNRTMLVMPHNRFLAARLSGASEIRTGSDPVTIGNNPWKGLDIQTSRFLYRRIINGGNAGAAVIASNAQEYWYWGDFQKAFHWHEHWPLIVEQQGSGSHWDFTRDILTSYKARYFGTAATDQPRYVVRSTN
jgi:hypothetical protein